MDVDPAIQTHLISICNAIGAFETRKEKERVYVPGDEVDVACLRDIKRYLMDEEGQKSRDIFLSIGKWKIVENQLIPLAVSPLTQPKTVSLCLELLVPLTWPIDMSSNNVPDQLIFMQSIKNAFCSQPILSVILKQLLSALAKDYKLRDEREHASILLMLTLIKNLLAIKPMHSSSTGSNESFLNSRSQDDLIIEMHKAKILDFLVAMAGSLDQEKYRDWNLILMEILYYMLRNRDWNQLYKNKENIEQPKTSVESQVWMSRHGRFGGSFSFELANGTRINALQSLTKVQDVKNSLNQGKRNRIQRTAANSKFDIVNFDPIESFELVKVYKEFIGKMLSNGFNNLYYSIKKDIDSERQNIDDMQLERFFSVLSAFLNCRNLMQETESSEFDTVTEFIEIKGFIFVFKKLDLLIDQKEKKMHLPAILGCLSQMIKTLQLMSTSTDYKDYSYSIQSKLLYEDAYHRMFLTLCRVCNQNNVKLLQVVVDNIHQFLKLLSDYCKANSLTVVKALRKKRLADTEGVTIDSDGEYEMKKVEKKFSMDKIYAAFATESTLELYFKLLKHYEKLNDPTIYQIATMFHRIAVQLKLPSMFFKPTWLDLFSEVLELKSKFKSKYWNELFKVIEYISGKLVSLINKYPLTLIEVFYPKSRQDCLRIQTGNEQDFSAAPKKSPELEIVEGFSFEQKIGICILALYDIDMGEMVDWISTVVDACIDARALVEKPNDFSLFASTSRQAEAFENNYFRLFLSCCKFQKVIIDANGKMWIIPSSVSTSDLKLIRQTIEYYLDTSFDLEGIALNSIIKTKRKTGKRTVDKTTGLISNLSKELISDSEDGDDEEFFRKEAENRKLKEEQYGKVKSIDQVLLEGTADNLIEDSLSESETKKLKLIQSDSE